ncbi:tetratricopeptide repeat protein [Paenibacillus yanchengensis]|uniref:Tetratricopeptide repeat protein n=1 Tax=Paenibacillus yanchengensis TaxID=2035833 RepID=A0ABW4YJW9_9BACL
MDGAACVQRAYHYILQNDFESAIAWFERAIALEPSNADFYYLCSISCTRSRKWQKAKDYASTALKLEPHNEKYHYQLKVSEANLLYEQAKGYIGQKPPALKQAAILLEKAVISDALHFEVRYTLSLVYNELGQWELAYLHASEALKLSPDHRTLQRLIVDLKQKL